MPICVGLFQISHHQVGARGLVAPQFLQHSVQSGAHGESWLLVVVQVFVWVTTVYPHV